MLFASGGSKTGWLQTADRLRLLLPGVAPPRVRLEGRRLVHSSAPTTHLESKWWAPRVTVDMHGVALSTSISGGAKDPADECSSEAAFPALPCTPPFLLRTPRRADALLIRCILTSQVLHLQATLSSGRVLLGAGVGKEDSIFSCKIRCAAALSASNPVPLPRAPACSLHAFLKLLSPDCLG